MSEWTDERIELLKQYWKQGLSSSRVAGLLGGVSRNSVIGKIHRLGLSGRSASSRLSDDQRAAARAARKARAERKVKQQQAARPAARASAVLFAVEPITPVEEIVVPLHRRRTVETIGDAECRWPIGDPQEPGFHFCGGAKVAGLPYCGTHSRRAFQPPNVRRPVAGHFRLAQRQSAVRSGMDAKAAISPSGGASKRETEDVD